MSQIVFFDFEKLEKACGTDYHKLYNAFIAHCTIQNPKYIGKSYIRNYRQLHLQKNVDIIYKIQYIKLASFRDYNTYRLYGFTYLDISTYPDLLLDEIKSNPLISIEKTLLKLKFEN